MTVRTLVIAALVAGAAPLFAQPPVRSEPRGTAPAAAQAPRTPAPAQTPRAETPAPAARTPAPATLVRREGQPLNVRVDLTITEQHGNATAAKKVVSIVVADGQTGYIRSQSDVFLVANQMPLNIDAEPMLLADGKIRLKFNVQYDLPATFETQSGTNPPRGTVMKTQLHDNMAVVLENGKAITVAQSADPVGDRQVTVEVKATVLR